MSLCGRSAVLLLLVAALLCLAHLCVADIYLHAPPGSNNRLNEETNNRQNNNRLFDSQNNGRGGYNVGENCPNGVLTNPVSGAATGSAGCTGDTADLSQPNQVGSLRYFENSKVYIEWTNQHGCGATQENTYCQQVLQYMCWPGTQAAPASYEGDASGLTDGTSPTGTQPTIGVHEPQAYYTKCATRNRNSGLYTADQKLPAGAKATNTRQNPNGGRSGSECSEERDYYPYWHPTPWIDIAVFTDEPNRCDYYRANSGNKNPWNECSCTTSCAPGSQQAEACWQHNNSVDCGKEAGCSWTLKTHADFWDQSYNLMGPSFQPNVECLQTFWTRDNHLGDNPNGRNNHYWWTVPSVGTACGAFEEDCAMCTLRIRYNITTADLGDLASWQVKDSNVWGSCSMGSYADMTKPIDYFYVDSRLNGDRSVLMDGVPNYFEENANVDMGVGGALRLAVNTAQYGRTFQDRSHKFSILSRPKHGVDTNACIVNILRRGRRGNIVQVYPAVEYDWTPNPVTVAQNTYINWQWTGSNTNPNNDGQGRARTDRSNLVELDDLLLNTPRPWSEDIPNKLFSSRADALRFATVNSCTTPDACNIGDELDDAPAYFNGGLYQVTTTGTWHYMCTRNNNFTNRSQKATVIVIPSDGSCHPIDPPDNQPW